MKRLSVFGATGSIGCNTVDLIARTSDRFEVVALTGGHNISLLAQQARQLRAQIAVTAHPERLEELRAALSGSSIEVAAGPSAIEEVATRPVDWAMSAIIGAAGLVPGLRVLEQGATLALANKESLVTAGPLLMETARRHEARILPVDSEHSAIFQALVGEDIAAVERIIITASGGALRDWPLDRMAQATVQDASSHPNWEMGQRITIDSASMFNKALEVIETKEFFGVLPEQIEVLIHPQSLVHALVGFRDGALMAHVGVSDMRHAIGYALNWPQRRALPVERLDLASVARLDFAAPDPDRYPALEIAREVMETGGLAGAIFNGAKECALDAFIAGRVGFMDMARIVQQVLDVSRAEGDFARAPLNLDAVLWADQKARDHASALIGDKSRQ